MVDVAQVMGFKTLLSSVSSLHELKIGVVESNATLVEMEYDILSDSFEKGVWLDITLPGVVQPEAS